MDIEDVLNRFAMFTGAGIVSVTSAGIVEIEVGGGVPDSVVEQALEMSDEAAFRLPHGKQFFLVIKHSGSERTIIAGPFDKLTEFVMGETLFLWENLSIEAAKKDAYEVV